MLFNEDTASTHILVKFEKFSRNTLEVIGKNVYLQK